jgi:signal transduction histidine kinase
MKISQDKKLNLYIQYFLLFLIVLNLFNIFYLIYNQNYNITFFIELQAVILLVFLLLLIKKNATLKIEIREQNKRYDDLLKSYNELKTKNSETLSELETTIAELKSLNLQLIKSKKELQEISDYRGKFLVNVSHELKTPLNAIIGFTTIMASDQYTPSEDFKEIIKIIHDSSKRLLTLINNILHLAKIETTISELNLKKGSLKSIAESIVSLAKGMLKNREKIIFNYEIDNNLPDVLFDEKYLSTALTEFLDNAVKYTEKGEIKFTVRKKEDHVEITISDTGIGITPEKLSEIQQPFLTKFEELDRHSKLTQENISYNFAIAKYLIEKMGAKFYITSTPNVGTTIKILISQGSN